MGLAAATAGCGPVLVTAPQSVPLDVAEADAQSKRFAPMADRAHIYVTRTSLRGSRNPHRILLNGIAVGDIAWNTHLMLEVQPGTHEVSVVTPENLHTVRVKAGVGENQFLATVSRTGLVHARAELQVLAQREGRQAVLDTRLAATSRSGMRSAATADSAAAGTYVNPTYRWSIAYPAGWRLEDAEPRFVKLRKGPALVGIHTGGVASDLSLEQYARAGLQAWERNLGNVSKEVSRRSLTLSGGLPALEVVHQIGTGVVGKSRKVIALTGDRGFWIDAEVYLQTWAAFEGEFEQIIGSFRVAE